MADSETQILRSSPFSLVADDSSSACWAGRTQVLDQLKKLCRSWVNRSDSTLDVVWANLGAGKTHALFHLGHLLETEFKTNPEAIVVYAEVPERDSHFIEIYRRLVSSLRLADIAKLSVGATKGSLSPSVARACRAIEFGSENEKRVATDWITAGRPAMRELRAVTGIDSRIESDVEAERVLSDLLGLAAAGGRRVVVLLDEFQRVGHLAQRGREAMLSHLRTLFSRQSSHFSLVLAVGTRMEKTALELLPSELKTIMGMRPTVSLPEMNKGEAVEFILRRLAWYRPEGYSGSAETPFSREQIDYVVAYLADQGKARLIPRVLLQVFGIVYDEISLESLPMGTQRLRESLDALRWEE
jgi:hypothetical protein